MANDNSPTPVFGWAALQRTLSRKVLLLGELFPGLQRPKAYLVVWYALSVLAFASSTCFLALSVVSWVLLMPK
jgi:hypothetical protein